MWQRVQTIFLSIIVLFIGIILISGIWHKENPQTKQRAELTAFELVYLQDGKVVKSISTLYIAITMGLVLIVSVYSIFSFKNRLLQMKLGLANSLLLSASLGGMVYGSFEGEQIFPIPEKGIYELGFYLCGMALVSNLLANRFIRKDEKLVNDDRLR